MNCHDALGRLNAFLDNEVPVRDALPIEEHLQECPACAAQFARERVWRAGLRAKADYHTAPDTLRRRVQAIAAQAPPPVAGARRRRTLTLTWPQLGAALATAALVTWTSTVVVLRPHADELTAEELVAVHVEATLGHRLTDVESSDQHTVKPWLSSRLDYSPTVRDLAADGFPLVGGRIARVRQRDIATLVYRYGNHVIDVFVAPDSTGAPATLRSIRGFNVAEQSGGGWRWSAVSDVNAEALRKLVVKLSAPPPR